MLHIRYGWGFFQKNLWTRNRNENKSYDINFFGYCKKNFVFTFFYSNRKSLYRTIYFHFKKWKQNFFYSTLSVYDRLPWPSHDQTVTVPWPSRDNRVTVPLPSRYISVTNIFFSVTNLWTFCYALSRFPKAYLEYRDKPWQTVSQRF
jgi:hypothetical protein